MKIFFNLLKYFFIVLVVSSALVSAIGAAVVFYFSNGLPNIIAVKDYHPPAVTKVLDKNGTVIGEFFEEKRYLVATDQIPEIVARAFVSAEDDRFFEHQGIDLQGILRAAFANFRAGKVVQGGSTITQQVAKSLLLTPERSFFRKIREVILASRMEKNLTKQQILYLYLNQIYLGHGAYGVEAASQVFFNKSAKDLSIAEAAILGGMPQAPSKYSPLINPARAKERQLYVLRRMNEDGVISKTQMEQAAASSLKVFVQRDTNLQYAPYFVEYVRKYAYDKYGKEALYQGGLNVKTTADARLSQEAKKSVQDGLRAIDKRQGYRGPIRHSKTGQEIENEVIEAGRVNFRSKYQYEVLLKSGSLAEDIQDKLVDGQKEEDIYDQNEIYQSVVVGVNDAKKEVNVKMGGIKAVLPLDDMKWARLVKEPSAEGVAPITKPSQTLERGDVIFVRVVNKNKNGEMIVSLEQTPKVQGALLSMDINTGEVLAMVGGYDYKESEFNRALQASRQPGSAYKPIIYSAAIDKGYTPATIVQDSPIVFDAGENLKWKPENYEEKFYGDTTFRQALIKSRNIPTIKIVQDIELPYLLEYSKRMGFNEESLAKDFSISLGSSSITMLDLVKTYAIFPRSGRKVKPTFILEITDRDGKVLEKNELTPNPPALSLSLPPPSPPIKVCGELQAEKKNGVDVKRGEFFNDPADPDRILDPRTAYVMTHLMNEVATVGTGAEAKNLGRPAAGKTGTTNDNYDAWFMGFTANVMTGVWVGFDNQRTIAPKATGAMVALPIWLDYMKEAIKNYPATDFVVPPGVVLVPIDGKTGKRVASAKLPGAVTEAFVEGTEPGSTKSYGEISGGTATSGASGAKSSQSQTESSADSGDENFYKEDIR